MGKKCINCDKCQFHPDVPLIICAVNGFIIEISGYPGLERRSIPEILAGLKNIKCNLKSTTAGR